VIKYLSKTIFREERFILAQFQWIQVIIHGLVDYGPVVKQNIMWWEHVKRLLTSWQVGIRETVTERGWRQYNLTS
jgi:hypothetical protein